MSKDKKPLRLMYDGATHKLVVVVARVPGCSLLVGLEHRPLTERQINQVVRGIVAACKKHGVDRRALGAQLVRLGMKLKF